MTEGLSCTKCSAPFPAGVKKPRRKVLHCSSCRKLGQAKATRCWMKKNPGKSSEYSRTHARLYPERRLASKQAYRARNPGRGREDIRIWRQKNPGYNKMKRDTDPQFRLRAYSRTRIHGALKGKIKAGRTFDLVGCSASDLRAHLESNFKPGMTWENYGPVWHVDHKRPCASFNLVDPVQQRECFHFSNLQPLFAEENLRKWAKV